MYIVVELYGTPRVLTDKDGNVLYYHDYKLADDAAMHCQRGVVVAC